MSAQLISTDTVTNIVTLKTASDQRLVKMKNSYDALLNEIAEKGMSPEIDEKVKNHIEAFKKAKDDINAKRMPYTRQLNDIVKGFTEIENSVGNLVTPLQTHRNTFAAAQIKAQEAIDRKAKLELAKKNEEIELRSAIEIEIRTNVINMISILRNKIIAALKLVTKENLAEKRKALEKMDTAIPIAYGSFETSLKSKLDGEYSNDTIAINNELLLSLEAELSELYTKEINIAKDEALQMMSQIANMPDDIKTDVINEATDVIALEKSQMIDASVMQAETTESMAQATLAFNTTLDMAPGVDASKSWKIDVLDGEGWAALVAYWFATAGRVFDGNWSTKTFESCKKDLERSATKTGTFMNHESIVYTEIIKAK